MTNDNARWELEIKADRILCRLRGEQIAYLGDGFPWVVTVADIRSADLVDPVRQAALRLGREAALIAARDSDGPRANTGR
ncbi:hypothetical protein [Paramicrobacterium chengjingii]|uniref:hypothetical protein n=1 Tax=Paramicrobacterium chengjingii TaxID=2769067 RepID=UPI0014220030|nr:hypothetical protein [Microbacterium chengjingii]